MTISSRTPEGHPNRCPVCRRRLRLSPSWPSADAPCPHCGSLVWFPTKNTPRATAGPAPGPDFTLDVFRKQIGQLKQMGPIGDELAGTPGRDDPTTGGAATELSLRHIQGMIDAMTRQERASPDIILDKSRCRRIAAGAGVRPQDVERFLRQFRQVRGLLKEMAHKSIWGDGGA